MSCAVIETVQNKMSQKVVDILIVRWPEAVMLTGLVGGLSFLAARLSQEAAAPDGLLVQMPLWAGFLLGISLMGMVIGIGMLVAGFLRSTVLSPLTARHPVELLQIGRPIFWKLFVPYLVFELGWTFLSVLLMTIFHLLLYGRVPAAPSPEWLLRLSQLIALTLLIKPVVLVPTFIILRNGTLWETLGVLRQIPLTAIKPLMRALTYGLAMIVVVYVLLLLIPFSKPFVWVRWGLLNAVGGAVLLVCFLTALKAIGSVLGPCGEEGQ